MRKGYALLPDAAGDECPPPHGITSLEMHMNRSVLLVALAAVSVSAFATQPSRVYFSSPVAQKEHLPFSSGVHVGDTLYIAGTSIDPSVKRKLDPAQEARVVMDRVRRVVHQAGMRMDDLVSIQVFCTNLDDYAAFNRVYRTYFHGHYPARAFIGVKRLLFGARYEVSGVAVRTH
ncbi:MAG TPA: Rid family hydrolase [Steroidobacteraceae bacterium]|nr:Rid family hydrolase [Steroidobacteraceae bacterium]